MRSYIPPSELKPPRKYIYTIYNITHEEIIIKVLITIV